MPYSTYKNVTYYEILNLREDATYQEIEYAYREAFQNLHPDVFKGDKLQLEAITKSVVESYAVLSDPLHRSAYDAQLKKQRAQKTSSKENSRQENPSTHSKEPPEVKKSPAERSKRFPFLVALISFAAGMAVMFGISAVFEFYNSPQQVQNTPSQSASQSSGKYDLVYYTPNGKKFHRENCSTIAGSTNVKHCMRNSIDKKLEPCSVCRP